MGTPNPPNEFKTLQILQGDGATPEVFAIIASINTQRSFKMDFQTSEYYIPDPGNPGKPVPKRVAVTGYGATMDVSGVASANDIVDLVEGGKTGDAKHYKLLDLETNKATSTLSMKLTALQWESDPSKNEPVNFTATLSVDGEFSFVDIAG